MSLERLGRFSCVGRQSEQSSAHEVSDGVDGQEDREPHDERDTEQPETRRGVLIGPLVEVVELGLDGLQHGGVPLHEKREARDREFCQFRIRDIEDVLFSSERGHKRVILSDVGHQVSRQESTNPKEGES